MDAAQRQPRWRSIRAARLSRRRRRLPLVPHAVNLYRTMSEALVTHRVDRRLEARHRARRAQGSAVSARSETMLWIAQRATAALLALCVVMHLATMIVAVRGGLTATEILGRTRGSVGWATFYGLVVPAGGNHAPSRLRHTGGGLPRTRR